MQYLSGSEIWEKLFVKEIHSKFHKDITLTRQFEDFITAKGGKLTIEHGATRTTNAEVFHLITRIANAFGLEVNGHYEFPDKKLKAVDLQFKDKDGFKWFSSLVEYKKLSPKAIRAIEDDTARTTNTLPPKSLELLEKLEKDGKLSRTEAETFVKGIIHKFMSRQGPPLKQSTYDIVSKESSETINALLLGSDFNHIAYLLNDLNIESWFAQEAIEILEALLKAEGFQLLPAIQGKVGGSLRQTSTQAEKMAFPIEDEKGKVSHINHPAKFLEFIQRGLERDSNGNILLDKNKNIKRFQGFLAANTEKLYEATAMKK